METLTLVQGTPEWHQYRATKLNASDAPAMLDRSKYKTRNELLRERATGVIAEVDAATQRRFDDGHRFEALARARAEEIIGEDLAPVVGYEGDLSASFDGITFMEDVIWEHKSINDDIRACNSVEELHVQYHIQMEQQLLVSGAEKCLFHATKWSNDGTLLEEKYFWYESIPDLRHEIIAGWEQLKKDLESYVFVEVVEPPKADAIKELPAITVQVKGELTLCNITDVTPLFDKFLSKAKVTLVTDDDFAQAEAEAKIGRDTAKKCRLTAKAVVDQMASVSEVVKTLELYADKFDKLALSQEKAVKEQKETRKAVAKLERDQAYEKFIVELEKSISPIRLVLVQDNKPDFVGAMKNQRTLSSLYNKLDAELARAKIAALSVSNDIRAKLDWCKESSAGYGFLFNDLQQIIYKSEDDFRMLVTTRIEQHKQAEAEKLEAERQRIAAEEKAKLEAAAKAEQAKLEEAEKAKQEALAAKPVSSQETPEQLREVAKRIADSAQYADRTSDMNRELAQAAALRKRADELEKAKTVEVNNAVIVDINPTFENVSITRTGDQSTVTIPTADYDKMIARLDWLDCLEAAGVDAWDGYDTAKVMYSEQQAA